MVDTKNFKTKTMQYQNANASVDDFWLIALDLGYSAVKLMSNNADVSFPSYARKLGTQQLLHFGESTSSDIQYRDDETGEIWAVGESAQKMIVSGEAKDSVTELYGRNRYYSDIFKVIAETGIAMGLVPNKYGDPEGKKIKLQTGLPPAYIKNDTDMLKDVLSGKHEFSLKVGNKPWMHFSYEIDINDIYVIPQPMGTLFSIATDNSGAFISDAQKYFKSSILIFDPGFGTLDLFSIRNRQIESSETFDNLGMKNVLSETSSAIMEKYGEDIPVYEMQQYLETGFVKCKDRKTRTLSTAPFADLLESANEKVCKEALMKTDTIYNNLFDYDYLVITGGTGAAWADIIKDWYKNVETLTIIMSNQNDNLPHIFSNVRGYYMYLLTKLNKMNK